MNNFQTILSAIFLAFFIFAVMIFSGMIKIGDNTNTSGGLTGKVVIWGTLTEPNLYKVFEIATEDHQDLNIRYIKKSPLTYQQDLIEAFASEKGPDLFFITPDMIIKNKDFFYPVPYESYPEKVFRDSFIDGANIFLAEDGIIGFPIVVDPMVLYYNKNMLNDQGLVSPPVLWNDLFNLNELLTKSENDGTILESMIALGRYDNINNSKEILSTFLLQSGDPIVVREGNNYVSVLDKKALGASTSPFKTILTFIMEFSNPSNKGYSWNRSLSSSFDMFVRGKLAFYLGKSSELFKIQSTNPNLSFDVAPILQTKNVPKRTFADIYAITVNKKSQNTSLAFSVSGLLSSKDTVKHFSDTLSLPPATKLLLSEKPTDPYMYSFYDSAIFSHSWIDPNPVTTNAIFGELFNNVSSNKLEIDAAINKAQGQLSQTVK